MCSLNEQKPLPQTQLTRLCLALSLQIVNFVGSQFIRGWVTISSTVVPYHGRTGHRKSARWQKGNVKKSLPVCDSKHRWKVKGPKKELGGISPGTCVVHAADRVVPGTDKRAGKSSSPPSISSPVVCLLRLINYTNITRTWTMLPG